MTRTARTKGASPDSLLQSVPIGDVAPRGLGWALAAMNKFIESRAVELREAEPEAYDYSTLTDQELAQEMLREFPELMGEARRMLGMPDPEQTGPAGS